MTGRSIHYWIPKSADLGSVNHSIVACAKHFIADGATIWGTGMDNQPDKIDRGNAPISDSLIRAKYLPPYQKAIDAGVGTVMASFNSINDLKCHANGYLFNGLVKSGVKWVLTDLLYLIGKVSMKFLGDYKSGYSKVSKCRY